MERTPFAGLTALDEDDPITIDGGSFGIRNPRITDTLLRVGAVTHRHDAHAPVPSPHVALSGFVASGGSIAASSNFALTYTVLDQQGGETAAAPPLLLSTGGQTPAPTIAPSATVVTSAGILPEGDYYYALTYTDGAGGETTIGPTTLITVPPGFASASVVLSSLAQELAPHGLAAQWRLWRSYEGEDWHLVSQASNDSFDDAGFDPPDNPARPPEQNTTAAHFALVVTLPTVAQDAALASGSLINLYLAPDANFTDPCFYQQLPIASAGATIVIPLDTVTEGSPPPVSLSKQGANQINPDTDILDWHWKRPVVTMTALPSGSQGDVRLALDTGHPFAVLSPSGAIDSHGWTDLLVLASTVIADIDVGLGVAGSGGIGLVDPVNYIEFVGSGETTIGVTQLGTGSARVTIAAPSAAAGGGSSGPGSIGIAASGGASAVNPDYYIEFAGSGGVGVAVQSLGGGSARVVVGPDGGALHWRGMYNPASAYATNDEVNFLGELWRARGVVPPVLPTLTGSTTVQSNTLHTATIIVPTTTKVGDTILIAAAANEAVALTTPTGYALLASAVNVNYGHDLLAVYAKTATAADIGSTVSLAGFVNNNPSWVVHLRSYTCGGVDSVATAGTVVTNTLAPPALTSSKQNELQVTFFGADIQGHHDSITLGAGGGNQFGSGQYITAGDNENLLAAEDFALAIPGSQSVGGAVTVTNSSPSLEGISVLLLGSGFNTGQWDLMLASGDTVAASGGASAATVGYTEFAASGGASVAVQSLGGGSARVVIGPGDGGLATLAGGSALVNDPSVTATVRIILTAQDNSSTGALRVSARAAGQNFTITSSNAGDSGSVAYQFFGS